MQRSQRLARRPDDGMIAGVAAGVAERYGVDPTLVRLGFVAVAVVSGGLATLAYLLAAIVMPRADDTPGIESVRHGVDDLVARGRNLFDETKKVIDRRTEGEGMLEGTAESRPRQETPAGTTAPGATEPGAASRPRGETEI